RPSPYAIGSSRVLRRLGFAVAGLRLGARAGYALLPAKERCGDEAAIGRRWGGDDPDLVGELVRQWLLHHPRMAGANGALERHVLSVRLAPSFQAVCLGIGELLARFGFARRLDTARLGGTLRASDASRLLGLGFEAALLDLAFLERQHVLHRFFLRFR